ncbi:MAG: NADH-quinone oxidoreductase subunit NuoH [Fibrobacteres bacterium]|jgi:NADH-quinone oxidoreductase subunit H|nr:NADH-quinone oxidoreductase subunit NuoH [Fibrobacterota bacterium]
MDTLLAILSNFWVIVAIKIAVGLGLVMGMVPMMVWMERKVSARFQLRRGPNRVGPFGLFQLIADSLKLLWKEDFFPRNTDRLVFLAAPIMAFLPGVLSFSLIPVGVAGGNEIMGPGGVMAVSYISLGLLVIMAISSVAAYGIAFAGWASNNQYSLLGGIRSSAQLISYEIVMGMAVVALILMTGTVNLSEIVQQQQDTAWNIIRQPITFILFLVAAFAETNRAPFDLPEAEQELVGGYHTEYTGMRYAWFMNGEYAAMFTMCAILTTLFLGGWTFPGFKLLAEMLSGSALGQILVGLLSFAIFFGKVVCLIFFFMWVRWTLPRFRWDQLMKLGWHVLIPIALANIIGTALFLEYVASRFGFGG